jgi:hypothetical protein
MRVIAHLCFNNCGGDATFIRQRLSMPGRSACFAKDQSLYQTNDRFPCSNGIVIANGEEEDQEFNKENITNPS